MVIKKIINLLKKYIIKKKYKNINKHNFTNISSSNFGSIDLKKINVGKYTYGDINVEFFNESHEFLKIGNYCSIASNVKFILGGGHDYHKFSTYPFFAKLIDGRVEAKCKGAIVVEDDVWIYGLE